MLDALPEQGISLNNIRLVRRYATMALEPTDFLCRLLRIPNDMRFIAAVSELLAVLSNPNVWEVLDVSNLERQRMAMLATDMLETFFESDRCMIGMILPHVRLTLPADFLPCLGGTYLKVDYPRLYAVIDPVYIVSPTEFRVPNYGDRVIYGEGVNDIDDIGGATTVTLTLPEIPTHTHTSPPHTHTDAGHTHTEQGAITGETIPGELPIPLPTAVPFPTITGVGFANIQATVVTIDNSGGGNAHENMPPFRTARFCIVAR